MSYKRTIRLAGAENAAPVNGAISIRPSGSQSMADGPVGTRTMTSLVALEIKGDDLVCTHVDAPQPTVMPTR